MRKKGTQSKGRVRGMGLKLRQGKGFRDKLLKTKR